MRIVVASDKFKEALSAERACAAIARGVRRAAPEADIDECPMADGGEGTGRALAAGNAGETRELIFDVCGPIPGTTVKGRVVVIDGGQTALIDMADAAGIALLKPEERDPTRTTSYGVGELIRHAVDAGCRRIVVGLGGSATCDAGLGAAQALGLHLEFEDGPPRGPVVGGDLEKLVHVDVPVVGLGARVLCLCDVDNPLVGERGTARAFAPQKGASPEQVDRLEAGVRHAAETAGRLLAANEPCFGAAGGLAFGLHLACKAEARPGVDAVADTARLEERLESARLCITGEGRFDGSSFDGKVVGGVAARCHVAEVPCIALVGGLDPHAAEDASSLHLSGVFPLACGPQTIEEMIAATEERLEQAAEQVCRFFLAIEQSAPHIVTSPQFV